MTIFQAKYKLQEARILARLIRQEISELRSFILSKGENPDPEKRYNNNRNLDIYNQWKAGKSFTTLAKEYNLSPSRISEICNRIKALNNQNRCRCPNGHNLGV